MTETAARLEAAHQDKLYLLKYLFAQVSHDGNDSVPPPIFPTALCEYLRSALDQIGIEDTAVRKVVYQAFADALHPNFQQMLANFEQVFQIDLSQPLVVGSNKPTQTNDRSSGPFIDEDSEIETTGPKSIAPPETSRQGSTSSKPGVFQSFQQLASANHGTSTAHSPIDLRPFAELLPSLAGTAERWQRGELAKKLLETVRSSTFFGPASQDLARNHLPVHRCIVG